MLPQRSIIPDPELSQDARREPVCVPLAGPGKLDDPARDKFGFVISRTDEKFKPRTRNVERLAHGFNVLGLESEGLGSRFWHRGITDVSRRAKRSSLRSQRRCTSVAGNTPSIAQGGQSPKRVAPINPIIHQKPSDEGLHFRFTKSWRSK